MVTEWYIHQTALERLILRCLSPLKGNTSQTELTIFPLSCSPRLPGSFRVAPSIQPSSLETGALVLFPVLPASSTSSWWSSPLDFNSSTFLISPTQRIYLRSSASLSLTLSCPPAPAPSPDIHIWLYQVLYFVEVNSRILARACTAFVNSLFFPHSSEQLAMPTSYSPNCVRPHFIPPQLFSSSSAQKSPSTPHLSKSAHLSPFFFFKWVFMTFIPKYTILFCTRCEYDHWQSILDLLVCLSVSPFLWVAGPASSFHGGRVSNWSEQLASPPTPTSSSPWRTDIHLTSVPQLGRAYLLKLREHSRFALVFFR